MKNNLKVYRFKFGFTQDDISKELKVSRQTINAIENNKYFPSLELGLKLAIILECKVDDLFSID
ncbi:MAG: helix-turn-helix transcriptional regulator [Flavobacteriaceae bacterium]|nr:helix-turn-helix transcriptional regulator [Flavobacteriaceae bacterium]